MDDTYTALREWIMDGRFRPGVALSQVQLALELDVSRTPLREAFRRLEAERLVVTEANRGVVVAPLALSDVEDSYAVRLLVEPALIAATLDRVVDADIEAMESALAAMRRPGVSPRDFQLAHWEYHRVILGRCPTGMRELVESHLTRIDRHQRLYFTHPEALEDVTVTDGLFLAAVRDRDGERARLLLEFHLLDAALGMILADDPDHEFGSIPVVLDGMSIRLDDVDALRRGGCARVSWDRGEVTHPIPALETSNLNSGAAQPDRSRTMLPA